MSLWAGPQIGVSHLLLKHRQRNSCFLKPCRQPVPKCVQTYVLSRNTWFQERGLRAVFHDVVAPPAMCAFWIREQKSRRGCCGQAEF